MVKSDLLRTRRASFCTRSQILLTFFRALATQVLCVVRHDLRAIPLPALLGLTREVDLLQLLKCSRADSCVY